MALSAEARKQGDAFGQQSQNWADEQAYRTLKANPGQHLLNAEQEKRLLDPTQDSAPTPSTSPSMTSLYGAPAPSPPAAPVPTAQPAPAPPKDSGSGVVSQPTQPPPQASAAPAMASLMQQQPPVNDISTPGPSGLRQGLGTRIPPQYNYALAALQRGAY